MKEFIASIITKVQHAHCVDFSLIEIEYKAESHIGHINFNVIDSNGKKQPTDPISCSLEIQEMDFLNSQFEAQQSIDKANSIQIVIKGINDYQITYGWDEALHQLNIGFALDEKEYKKS